MKIIIIGVIIIAIAIAVGALTISEPNTNSGEKVPSNISEQSYEEEITSEGNNYSITLSETVGSEIVP